MYIVYTNVLVHCSTTNMGSTSV